MNKTPNYIPPHVELDPTEFVRKIRAILCRAHTPKPIQEIADEIHLSYEEIMRYIVMEDKIHRVKFSKLDDGKQAVKYVTSARKAGNPES
jgi:hypothetical protein